jgi:hypothetical protein
MRMFALGVLVTMTAAWAAIVDVAAVAAWIHPWFLTAAIAPSALIVILACTPWYSDARKAKWMAMSAFLSCAALVVVPWNERKRFVHDLYSVRVGMSVGQARSVMRQYVENMIVGPSSSGMEEFSGTLSWRWSARSRYDADVGEAVMDRGRVVHVRFLADGRVAAGRARSARRAEFPGLQLRRGLSSRESPPRERTPASLACT